MFISVSEMLYALETPVPSSATLQGCGGSNNRRTLSNLQSFIISNIHHLDVLLCFPQS